MAIGRRTARGTRWQQDNRIATNPAPWIVLGVGALLLAGLFLLFWLV